MSPPAKARTRVFLALAIAWAVLVVAVYYRQLWAVLAAGPDAWHRPELGQSLRYSGVPWLHEAAARAVSGIGAAAVVIAAVWTCGRLVARWTVPSDATLAERRVIELATGVGVFAYVSFALALGGWYVPAVVAALSLALACAGAVLLAAEWWFTRPSTRVPQPAARNWIGTLVSSPWIWLSAAACAIAFVCALAPEREYDALWYHLELPRRWLQAGRPVDDVNEFVSLYPLTWDLLFGAALSLDGDVGAKLVHWITLPLSGLLAAWLARRIDDRTPPALAFAVAVTAPTVLWEATTAYVDLALAFHAALAVYALVRANETGSRQDDLLTRTARLESRRPAPGARSPAPEAESTRPPGGSGFSRIDRDHAHRSDAASGFSPIAAEAANRRRWLLVAALQLGLCCATKHLGLLIVAAALLAWMGARLYGRGFEPRTIGTAVLIGVVALLVPAPWYIRSLLASGNPVFPELYGVFGAWPPERWNGTVAHALKLFKDQFGRPRTPANLLLLPWDVTMHAARYGGSFGPVLLAFLPGTVLVAARSRVGRVLALGALAYVALWASPFSAFQMRFVVPLWIVVAPLVAGGIQALIDAAGAVRRSLRIVVTGAVVAVLVLDLPPATSLHEGDRVGWSGWLTHVIHELPVAVVAGGVSRQSYLDKQVRSAAAWRWMNANTPAGTRVLTFVGGDQFLADRARLWSETPTGRQVTWETPSGDVRGMIRRMRGLGIEYVLVQKLLRPPEFEELLLLRQDVLASHFEIAYEDFWMLVYRLRPTGEVATPVAPDTAALKCRPPFGDPASAGFVQRDPASAGLAGRTEQR